MQESSKPALSSDFVWYHSEGDDDPIHRPCSTNKMRECVGEGGEPGMSSSAYYVLVIIDLLPIGPNCIQRSGWGRKMAEAFASEKANEHGNPMRCFMDTTAHPPWKPRQAKKQHIDPTEVGASSDENDHDYQDTDPIESESTSPSEGDCQDTHITLPSNAEASSLLCYTGFILRHVAIYMQVADILPSKMIPAVGWGASGKQMRSKPAASFEIEPISHTSSMCSNNDTHETVSKPMVCLELPLPPLNVNIPNRKVTRNPIYHFYEAVNWNANGDLSNPGDRHYKCLHGTAKVLTITKKMKYSLNGEC